MKPDQTNLNGWLEYSKGVQQEDGQLNVVKRGFSPITRFKTGNQAYNLPARDGRKPLLAAGATPGSLLDWAISFALFPNLKAEIIRVDPWVVHPGTKVRHVVHGWSDVSVCWGFDGHAECHDLWVGLVNSFDALFALL